MVKKWGLRARGAARTPWGKCLGARRWAGPAPWPAPQGQRRAALGAGKVTRAQRGLRKLPAGRWGGPGAAAQGAALSRHEAPAELRRGVSGGPSPLSRHTSVSVQDGPWRLWPLSPSLGFWPHGATGGGPAVPGASRSAASPLNPPRRSHEPSAEHLSQEWLCGLGVAGRRPSQAALRRTEGRCAWLRPPPRLGRWSAGRSPPCGAGGTRPLGQA